MFPSLDSPRLTVWQGIRCYVPLGTLPLVDQTPVPQGPSLFALIAVKANGPLRGVLARSLDSGGERKPRSNSCFQQVQHNTLKTLNQEEMRRSAAKMREL